MHLVRTYGELFAAVREQIARDLGPEQVVAICPYGSLFRSRSEDAPIEADVLGGTHAKTIDVMVIVRERDAALAHLARALAWNPDETADAVRLARGETREKTAAGGAWHDRALSLAVPLVRSTIGELILRSAFPARHLVPVAQPCPLYGFLNLEQPLRLRFANGTEEDRIERYKLGVISLDAFLGPDVRERLARGENGYAGGASELEHALDPRSSAYVQLRFLGQNPDRVLRFAEAAERPVLQAKLHGLSCSAAYAALLLLADQAYPLPEPGAVGVTRWGLRVPGATAFAWDEIAQCARGASFLAEVAVKMKILHKHESAFGPDGIYAREILADGADAAMFLEGVNAFLGDYRGEACAIRIVDGEAVPVTSIAGGTRREHLVLLPDTPSAALSARAGELWDDTLARLNATFASTNAVLHRTSRLLRRPQAPKNDVVRADGRSALEVIRVELAKALDRVLPQPRRAAPAHPLARPWPVELDDPAALARIAAAWGRERLRASPPAPGASVSPCRAG